MSLALRQTHDQPARHNAIHDPRTSSRSNHLELEDGELESVFTFRVSYKDGWYDIELSREEKLRQAIDI